ncbi:MAG: hypothetical protein JSW39_03610 [Desulfobacterales bacterium]|nr:MAG: hypothetical protein JSW39_03610 [Desulfobacterales bacterium]
MITVHDGARDAQEQARCFAPWAARYGVVLVAPLFPENNFSDYHCLGYRGKGERADQALDQIISEVNRLTGAHTAKFYLFGFSEGAQFVHRYALAYPQRIARMVVAAADWYTFPDSATNYPFGTKKVPQLPNVRFEPAHFLKVPACVIVGDEEADRKDSLIKSPQANHHQGPTRFDRGKNWIQAMRAAARTYALNTPYGFHVLPGCTHSFRHCMDRYRLGRLVFDFLFGPATALKTDIFWKMSNFGHRTEHLPN